VFMVHGGANKAGRFLEVAVFAEGGRKGAVWILEGRDGQGWHRFAGELQLMLASPESCSKEPVLRSSPSVKPAPTKIAEVRATAEWSKDRSFTEVLLSKSCPELEGRFHGEVKNSGVRIDEVYESPVRVAGSAWKRRGSAVEDWVSQLLGFVQIGLGRVVAGLLEGLLNGPEGISIRKRVRAILETWNGSLGFAVGPPPLHPSSGRIKGLRLNPSRRGKGVGIGLSLKSKRATRLQRPRRVRSSASENISLGTPLQVPEVSMGLPEVEPWVSERDLGGVSGFGSEGSFQMPVPESPLHAMGLELSSLLVGASCVGCPAIEGSASGVKPIPLAVIPAKESSLPLSAAASISEDYIAFGAGDGSSQTPVPGFAVPFAEDFLGFLPACSLSKDWEDFYSSLPSDRGGMTDSELFALPWEVDVPVSPSCRDKEVSSSRAETNQMVRPSAPARSLLRRGFFCPRAVSPPPVVLKEVLPVIKGKDLSTEVGSTTSVPVLPLVTFSSLPEDKQGVQTTVDVVLPLLLQVKSSVSLSQKWYNRRVKEKVAKQVIKNKELIAEAMGVIPVVGEDRVVDALNLAPVLGLTWGGEDKKLRDLVEATVPKVKGMRELKNLDCAISPVKGKRRRGWSGSKNAFLFPPEVH
jgi:hypothetical protein